MIKVLLSTTLLFTFLSFYAQNVSYNFSVDKVSNETKEIIRLFENYIASNPQKKENNPFWNSADQESYNNYDFLESEFQPSLYMGFPVHVLSIKFIENTAFIKAQFSYTKEDGTPYILAIVNYIAKKENGEYKLYNALIYNRQNWNHKQIGLIDYYYPPTHIFNLEKAEEMNAFIKKLCSYLNVSPIKMEYYFAEDFDEVQNIKGIDYYMGMGGPLKPSGKASENKVYCGGLGEFYPHEVCHVQIDSHFPNHHFWASEGLATYLGGSRGKDLKWHIMKANSYLQKHPEIDLKDMLTLKNLDSETAFHYVLGGLIVKKTFEKGGWEMVRDFLSSGKTDEDYYHAIQEYLNVDRSELNNYLRTQLKIEAGK